jgi:hypothetical protein
LTHKKAEEQMWEKERKRLTTVHTYETRIYALGNGLSYFFRSSRHVRADKYFAIEELEK